jgi:hypothetical protein
MTKSYSTRGTPTVEQIKNVSADSALNNQGLIYNSTTELWENKNVATSTSPITGNLGDVIVADGASGITSTDKLFVDTGNGKVGIGTTTPGARLNIIHPASTSIPALQVASTGSLANNDIVRFQINAFTNGFRMFQDATSALNYTFQSGKVGIGTITPTNTLNVIGGLVPLKVEPTGSGTDGVNLTLDYTGLTFNTTATGYKTFAITNSLTGDALGLMNFNNGGSTRMTIANAGNVGIGTTSPTSKLHIEEPTTVSGSAGINVQKTGTITGNSYGVLSQTTGTATTNYGGFFTASGATNNYGLVVSAGNVGIGTTAPAYDLQIGITSATVALGGAPTTNSSGRLKFINSNTVTNWQISTNDSTSGAFEIMPSTVLGGSIFTTPAMKISSVGAVTIGNLGSGTVQATAGVLSIVSDARLKDEDGFVEDALTKVLHLKPRYFKWKKNNSAGLPHNIRQLGFFAQEVQAVLGEEVVNSPPEGGNYGIHDRGLIAMLVKAMQEQQVIIDSLDNRLKLIETK